MYPFSPGIAALSSKARNDGGMDSRFRGNDPGKARLYGASIKGSGNDTRDTE